MGRGCRGGGENDDRKIVIIWKLRRKKLLGVYGGFDREICVGWGCFGVFEYFS